MFVLKSRSLLSPGWWCFLWCRDWHTWTLVSRRELSGLVHAVGCSQAETKTDLSAVQGVTQLTCEGRRHSDMALDVLCVCGLWWNLQLTTKTQYVTTRQTLAWELYCSLFTYHLMDISAPVTGSVLSWLHATTRRTEHWLPSIYSDEPSQAVDSLQLW